MGGKEILQLCVYVSLYALSERDRCPKNSSLSLFLFLFLSLSCSLFFLNQYTLTLLFLWETLSLSLTHCWRSRLSCVCQTIVISLYLRGDSVVPSVCSTRVWVTTLVSALPAFMRWPVHFFQQYLLNPAPFTVWPLFPVPLPGAQAAVISMFSFKSPRKRGMGQREGKQKNVNWNERWQTAHLLSLQEGP